MKMRPSMPIILDDMGRWSSIPWISAFSSDGAALMTRGVMGAETAAYCWTFWREEVCRRRTGRVVIYTVVRSRTRLVGSATYFVLLREVTEVAGLTVSAIAPETCADREAGLFVGVVEMGVPWRQAVLDRDGIVHS